MLGTTWHIPGGTWDLPGRVSGIFQVVVNNFMVPPGIFQVPPNFVFALFPSFWVLGAYKNARFSGIYQSFSDPKQYWFKPKFSIVFNQNVWNTFFSIQKVSGIFQIPAGKLYIPSGIIQVIPFIYQRGYKKRFIMTKMDLKSMINLLKREINQ